MTRSLIFIICFAVVAAAAATDGLDKRLEKLERTLNTESTMQGDHPGAGTLPPFTVSDHVVADKDVDSTCTDPNLEQVLNEYGQSTIEGLFKLQTYASSGGCKPEGDYLCKNFYTWEALTCGIADYNKANSEAPFLGDPTVEGKAQTLCAFMSNIYYETMMYTACKERVRLADGSCPADTLHITGGCSGGKIGDYTSAKAAENGWSITTCNDANAPSQGCHDFWGNPVEPSTNCWFGRGALQLTWPGNYDVNNHLDDVNLCANPDAICDSGSVAFEAASSFWMNSAGQLAWSQSYDINVAITQLVAPADPSTNADRAKLYDQMLDTLGITPPAPAPPTSDYTKRCGVDWGTANAQCGTPCPEGTDAPCPSGEKCQANLVTDPCKTKRCGVDWSTAEKSCGKLCPSGMDGECPSGQHCQAGLSTLGCMKKRCGKSWSAAEATCGTICEDGTDAPCPSGQHCQADLSVGPCSLKRCGTSWADANNKCGTMCPQGTDAPCPPGEHCQAELSKPCGV